MDTQEWDSRIEEFYESEFTEQDPQGSIAKMLDLVALLPEGDARGAFELGGVHDSLGDGQQAIVYYRQAIAAGLTGERASRVVIQLASTLRTVGEVQEAINLLTALPPSTEDYDAAQAFWP